MNVGNVFAINTVGLGKRKHRLIIGTGGNRINFHGAAFGNCVHRKQLDLKLNALPLTHSLQVQDEKHLFRQVAAE